MIIGIDASNLRSGGAITHLNELLKAASPTEDHFAKIIVWAEKNMIQALPDRPWLLKIHEPLLDKSLMHRLFWQTFHVSQLARRNNCDLLFIPSGIVLGNFYPVVTMSHNLLPFEWREIKRYGISWQLIRNLLLRKIQSYSFKKSSGIIFLSKYAEKTVLSVIKKTSAQLSLIPHGVNDIFSHTPRPQKKITEYSTSNPFILFYLSTVDMYKHQWNIAEAVAQLKDKGYPIVLYLAGSSNRQALKKLQKTVNKIDPERNYIKYLGALPYDQLPNYYLKSDLYIFASSCENMPNILLEAMASGLPIACSNRGPMPEVLRDAGVYFDPENVQDVTRAIKDLIDSPELRERSAGASFVYSKNYSWTSCARQTFKFFRDLR